MPAHDRLREPVAGEPGVEGRVVELPGRSHRRQLVGSGHDAAQVEGRGAGVAVQVLGRGVGPGIARHRVSPDVAAGWNYGG